MHFSDIDRTPDTKKLRFFGLTWLLFFSGIGAFRVWQDGDSPLGWGLLAAGVVVGVLGFLNPWMLWGVFVGATIVTFPIGWTISHLLLGIVYYLMIVPLGLLFRVMHRDPLRLRKPKLDSYWVENPQVSDSTQYFREF